MRKLCNNKGLVKIPRRKKEVIVPKPRQLSNGRWYIYLRLQGMAHSITDTNYNRCIARARAIKAGIIEAETTKKDMETVGEAIDTYIASNDGILSPSTIRAYKSYRKNRFKGIMDIPVQKLTLQTLQKAINDELKQSATPQKGSVKVKKISPKTVLNALRLITPAIEYKCNFRLDRLNLPQYESSAGRAMSFEEIKIFLRELQKSKYELPILLALWCGMRRSEIAALEKKNFDFKNNIIHVGQALVQNDDNEWVYKKPKSKAGERDILCDRYIMDKVKALPDNGGRLFTMHPNTLYKEVQKICQRTQIPHTRLHDLRHTAASLSEYLNIPSKYIMERGGWSSKPVLEKTYTHTLEKGIEEAAEKINTLMHDMLPNDNPGEEQNVN